MGFFERCHYNFKVFEICHYNSGILKRTITILAKFEICHWIWQKDAWACLQADVAYGRLYAPIAVSHLNGAAKNAVSTPPLTLILALHLSVSLECNPSVSAIKPIVGFGVDDHRIRELMIISEMTSRELRMEDVKQFGGSPIHFEKVFSKRFNESFIFASIYSLSIGKAVLSRGTPGLLIKCRIKCSNLLFHSQSSVKSVALSLCFADWFD